MNPIEIILFMHIFRHVILGHIVLAYTGCSYEISELLGRILIGFNQISLYPNSPHIIIRKFP